VFLVHQLTTGRYQDTSSNDMHACHTSDQLGTSQDHTTTAKDIVDQIEQYEDLVSILAISHAHELERGMCVRNSKFCNNTKEGHEGDLER
jgi:hypothetical protein